MNQGGSGTGVLALLERLELLLPPEDALDKPDAVYLLESGMRAYREQLQRLLPFARLGVWLCDDDGLGFTLALYWPPGFAGETAQAMLDRHIDTGSFALALRQNRALVAAPDPHYPGVELLHVMSTHERVIGMFIGQLLPGAAEPDALTLKLFSLLIVQATHALQIRLLYRAIHAQNNSLEEQVRVRTREAELARDQAELANRAKTLFLSGMSHELRTPLTAVIGYAEQIQLRLDAAGTAQADREMREYADIIVRNARHLLGLISDILDVSKIESQRLQLERIAFDPVAAAEEVGATCRVLAQAAGIGFRFDYRLPLPRRLHSDPLRFRQILLNLCSNAIKFTPQGEVCVLLEWLPDRALLRATVTDTGIGIPVEQQAHILEPFRQADSSTTRRYGGAGLGLYICHRLAAMLGGELAFRSEPGIGSVFSFTVAGGTVPEEWLITDAAALAAQRAPVPVAAPVRHAGLRGRVLVVDDWPDNRRLIGLYLDGLGLEHAEACDGEQAVEKALAEDFDLLLMDVQMPVMNGEDATALLRASGFRRPIIALTANVLDEDRARYLAGGFDRVLAKPIDREALWQTLAAQLAPAPPGQVATHASDAAAARHDARLRELRRQFVAGLPARVTAMRAAASRADHGALAGFAHDLKGSGGSFGHPALGTLARELEAATRAGNGPAIDAIMTRLDEAVREVVDGR